MDKKVKFQLKLHVFDMSERRQFGAYSYKMKYNKFQLLS